MQVIHTAADLRTALQGKAHIAFVPTMGNLHAGHIALVNLASTRADCVVVSIFVNPMQFGPGEDFSSYPRTLNADCEKLKNAGATLVYAPSVNEMYPDFDPVSGNLGQTMIIKAPPIANELCGHSRPGHFDGVATVVMKLFNMVMPQVAVFGKKDFQQLHIIQEMVRQFNLPIEIIAGETVREPSGLAMSSRNGYLSESQKIEAARLNHCLQHIVNQIRDGSTDFQKLEQHARIELNAHGWVTDYISIRNALTLHPAQPQDTALVILGAAKLGNTRLIDNIAYNKHQHQN